MRRLLVVASLVAGLFGSVVGPVRAEVTAEQVHKAIDRGVAYLLEQQRNNGAWPDMAMPGGVTALCTLALLNAGVEPDDERMQKALDYLRTIKPDKTYVVSLQTMVFARAEPEKDRLSIRDNVEWLEKTQLRGGSDPAYMQELARKVDERMKALRKRATIARRAVRQWKDNAPLDNWLRLNRVKRHTRASGRARQVSVGARAGCLAASTDRIRVPGVQSYLIANSARKRCIGPPIPRCFR